MPVSRVSTPTASLCLVSGAWRLFLLPVHSFVSQFVFMEFLDSTCVQAVFIIPESHREKKPLASFTWKSQSVLTCNLPFVCVGHQRRGRWRVFVRVLSTRVNQHHKKKKEWHKLIRGIWCLLDSARHKKHTGLCQIPPYIKEHHLR